MGAHCGGQRLRDGLDLLPTMGRRSKKSRRHQPFDIQIGDRRRRGMWRTGHGLHDRDVDLVCRGTSWWACRSRHHDTSRGKCLGVKTVSFLTSPVVLA